MAKISINLMGGTPERVEVNCFTIPGPGVCLTIKTPEGAVEIDLPEKIWAMVMEHMGKPEIPVSLPSG